MERIGFVGLGIMGSPMARNAIKAGFPVTVTNRTLDRAKPLAEAGATVVRTPKEVAARSDLVVTMVTSSPDVEAVTFGLFSRVQLALAAVVDVGRNGWGNYIGLRGARAENETLKRQLADLEVRMLACSGSRPTCSTGSGGKDKQERRGDSSHSRVRIR